MVDSVERIVRAAPLGDAFERAQVLDEVSRALFGAPPPPLRLGRYRVLERIGGGGQGVVYAGHDPQLGRRVAIKVLRIGAEAREASERLRREAAALAQLAHPNVIAIHDVGSFAGGVYIVMQLVPGQTLASWLRVRRSWREVLVVFDGAGRGLAAAHQRGIVHRDFKPANVWIGDDGVVRLLDFGLARALADVEREPSMPGSGPDGALPITATGHVVGTPGYMAPEQHDGDTVTAASDQYGYCVALFEALYGSAPFAGASLDVLLAAKRSLAVAPIAAGNEVPAWLRPVVVRGLQPDPAQRWPSMEALLRALAGGRRSLARRVATLAVPLVGAAALAGVWLDDRATDHACTRGGALDWSEARAHGVTRSIEDTALPFAHDVAGRVTAGFDRVAARWHEVRAETCAALDRDPGADRRMACLDRVAGELDDTLAILQDGSVAAIEHADELMRALPDPARCGTGRLDDDDPQRAELRRAIARARALALAGDAEAALELARDNLTAAETLGDDDLCGEAATVYGGVLHERGRQDEAIEMLESGYLRATAADDDTTAFDAALHLVDILSSSRQNPQRCGEWVQHAAASLARSGDHDPVAQGRLAQARARWAFTSGKPDEAAEHAGEAAALLEDAGDPRANRALDTRARALVNLGNEAEALATAQHNVEVAERLRGPDHPATAGALVTLAVTTFARGDITAALAMLGRAREIYTRVHGPDDERVAETMRHTANMQLELGHYEVAAAGYREVLAIQRRHRGPDDTIIAQTLFNLSQPLRELGQLDEAAALGRESIRIAEAKLGDHMTTAIYLHGLGETLVRGSDPQQAIAPIERACAIVRPVLGEAHGLYRTFAATLDQARTRATK